MTAPLPAIGAEIRRKRELGVPWKALSVEYGLGRTRLYQLQQEEKMFTEHLRTSGGAAEGVMADATHGCGNCDAYHIVQRHRGERKVTLGYCRLWPTEIEKAPDEWCRQHRRVGHAVDVPRGDPEIHRDPAQPDA